MYRKPEVFGDSGELTAEEQQKARRKALLLLEHMDRTERGLTDRLRQAGFSEAAAKDAVAYVKSYGYVDDARYAVSYLTGRCGSESRGSLLQKLQAKGVDRGTALAAWDEVASLLEPDESAVLKDTIRKKWEPDSELDEREYRRLYGLLMRRGFASEDISRVLEELNIRLYKN